MAKRLHLLGTDSEDLAIISACLQDAVTCLGDMAFLSKKRRFAMVLNRFRWEAEESGLKEPERIRTGVHFDGVMKVRRRGLPAAKGHPLELLAIQAEETPKGATIMLYFAGGGAILLEAECIDCQMTDLSEPWATRTIPRHAQVTNDNGPQD